LVAIIYIYLYIFIFIYFFYVAFLINIKWIEKKKSYIELNIGEALYATSCTGILHIEQAFV